MRAITRKWGWRGVERMGGGRGTKREHSLRGRRAIPSPSKRTREGSRSVHEEAGRQKSAAFRVATQRGRRTNPWLPWRDRKEDGWRGYGGDDGRGSTHEGGDNSDSPSCRETVGTARD